MNFCVLGSGSKGNCTYVESGSTSLLIDAGFSGREIQRRLELINKTAENLTAIIVTHEHGDHISGVGVLSRRYNIPVYANPETHLAAEKRVKKLHERKEFQTGEKFFIHDLEIHPFRISHDTKDPVGFVIADAGHSLGYCTDTGRITKLIEHHINKCGALILEANHDPQMLMDGPYPMPLKQRVRSNQGHLGNGDAARFLAGLSHSSLQYVVLAHLSETNNYPELAHTRVQKELNRLAINFTIILASQTSPTPVISLADQQHTINKPE
ncbi:MAG: MBL fold metallo-hydrolase [Desulfobulbus sp.]|nr:MAG: MBL fold metallo-hydrolase [Desulfobulbus sp.]